jgi:hypothetical protein
MPSEPTPRVFISYAHDSDEHRDRVLRFASFLRPQGINAVLDAWYEGNSQDWYAWVIRELTGADYVLVVASPRYRQVGDGSGPEDLHRGVQSEAALLRELIYGSRDHWRQRVLSVLLDGHSADEIPLFLQPHSASRYTVRALTVANAAPLLRVLLRRPEQVPLPVAQPPDLPPTGAPIEWDAITGHVAPARDGYSTAEIGTVPQPPRPAPRRVRPTRRIILMSLTAVVAIAAAIASVRLWPQPSPARTPPTPLGHVVTRGQIVQPQENATIHEMVAASGLIYNLHKGHRLVAFMLEGNCLFPESTKLDSDHTWSVTIQAGGTEQIGHEVTLYLVDIAPQGVAPLEKYDAASTTAQNAGHGPPGICGLDKLATEYHGDRLYHRDLRRI